MGQEERCVAMYNGAYSEGKALLETDEIIFRGEFRLKISLTAISSVTAEDGELHVAFDGQQAAFVLGKQAARWKARIENPPTLLDKLGVKAQDTVSVLGVADDEFAEALHARGARVVEGTAAAESDHIFLGAESVEDLKRLVALRGYLAPTGGVWVVAPKGQKHIREADVLAAGKPAGLVDVKVARFSATHTAHRFVIPVSQR
jgi:hypothetical protein